MNQYNDVSSQMANIYSNYFASKIGILDKYIATQTSPDQYSCLIYRKNGEIIQYDIYRDEIENRYRFFVSSSPSTWDYEISNELYCYSNIGLGTELDLPVKDNLICWGILIICASIFIRLFFGSLLSFSRYRHRELR